MVVSREAFEVALLALGVGGRRGGGRNEAGRGDSKGTLGDALGHAAASEECAEHGI